MKIIAIYDNGGETLDRYTFVLNTKHDVDGKYNECLATCSTGLRFSQFSSCQAGKHLGKKIKMTDIPKELQSHVKNRLA